NVLARADRGQRDRAAVVAHGQVDHCCDGETSLGRQTHGEVLCGCGEFPGTSDTRLFESSVPFYLSKILGFSPGTLAKLDACQFRLWSRDITPGSTPCVGEKPRA